MFRCVLFSFLLSLMSCACAQNSDSSTCKYDGQVVKELSLPKGGELVGYEEGLDEYSDEVVYNYSVMIDGQDLMLVEQKYCEMYNMSVIYKIKRLDQTSFEGILDNIERIAESARQDYHLKAPLKLVVNMAMNKNKLTLDNSFDIGLSGRAVTSSENVEHSISFTPLAKREGFDAEVKFYFGIGGD